MDKVIIKTACAIEKVGLSVGVPRFVGGSVYARIEQLASDLWPDDIYYIQHSLNLTSSQKAVMKRALRQFVETRRREVDDEYTVSLAMSNRATRCMAMVPKDSELRKAYRAEHERWQHTSSLASVRRKQCDELQTRIRFICDATL